MKDFMLITASIAFAMMVLSLLVWAAAYVAVAAIVLAGGWVVWRAVRE